MNKRCPRIIKAGNPKRINKACGRKSVIQFYGESICGTHLRHAIAPKNHETKPTMSELIFRIRTLEDALAKRGIKV